MTRRPGRASWPPAGQAASAATEINGLRFAYLALHAPETGRVTVRAVRVREHLYPRTGRAYFSSSDPALDALYNAGVRTVQLNSFDSYTDCPTASSALGSATAWCTSKSTSSPTQTGVWPVTTLCCATLRVRMASCR